LNAARRTSQPMVPGCNLLINRKYLFHSLFGHAGDRDLNELDNLSAQYSSGYCTIKQGLK
jgi:hypothetical protein